MKEKMNVDEDNQDSFEYLIEALEEKMKQIECKNPVYFRTSSIECMEWFNLRLALANIVNRLYDEKKKEEGK